MIKIAHLQAAFVLTLSTSALGTSIEPEKIYEQNVAHYQTGYYSQLGADFSSEADGQEDSANVASQEVDEETAPISDDPQLLISGNEYELSQLERIGLEKLFAQDAQKYRLCIKRKEPDCYTDEIFYLQSLLDIYLGKMDASRPKFRVRSTDAERRFTRTGKGVLYQFTTEFSEDAGLVITDSCLEGRLAESQKRWTPSDKNCANLKAYGDYIRTWYQPSLLSEQYRDIPFRFSRSTLRSTDYSGYGRTQFAPCRVIGTTKCAKANRLLKKQDWHGLKAFVEVHESESYLWNFYKAQANSQLGDTSAAVDNLNALISSFPSATEFSAHSEWEYFVRFAASILVSHYYATGDFQSVVDCCQVIGIDTVDLGVKDSLIMNAQVMRASAMTLIESPRIATAVSILFELRKTLDRLDLPEDARIRLNADQQLTHLRQQLETIGRGAATS